MSESETEVNQESEITQENDVTQEEGPHPKKRSLVWQFFEKTSRYRVRCHLCQHEQNYQGTTGNILRHLKSKHDLDMTLKGQQDPENQKRIKELCGVAVAVSGKDIKIERKLYHNPIAKPSRKQSFDDGYDVNPYEEDNDVIYPLETYMTAADPFHVNEDSMTTTDGEKMTGRTKRDKSELEEERIKAETQYFREKAGYYKLQKHLTALQAKKVKIEIEQLTSNSNKID